MSEKYPTFRFDKSPPEQVHIYEGINYKGSSRSAWDHNNSADLSVMLEHVHLIASVHPTMIWGSVLSERRAHELSRKRSNFREQRTCVPSKSYSRWCGPWDNKHI